jgi:hypothetical protein
VHDYIFHLTQTQFLNFLLIFFAAAVYGMKWKKSKRKGKKEEEEKGWRRMENEGAE